MQSYTVIGYIYQADVYCEPCAAERVTRNATDEETERAEAELAKLSHFPSHQEVLNAYGRAAGIADPEDEYSYDSDHHPKVIFADHYEGDTCGNCHEPLIEDWS